MAVKKSQVFTSLSILILGLFLLSVLGSASIMKYYGDKKETEQIESKVVIALFERLEETILSRATSIATTTALRATLSYVNDTGTTISDFDTFFYHLVSRGAMSRLYTPSIESQDLAFFMTLKNSSVIIDVSEELSSTQFDFGSDKVIIQGFNINSSVPVGSVSIYIENNGAINETLFLLIYDDNESIAQSKLLFTEDGWYTFNFTNSYVVPDPDKEYYLFLTAPFDASSNAYSVNAGLSGGVTEPYECDLFDCTLATSTIGSGSDDILWPIDFYLGQEIMETSSIYDTVNSLSGIYLTNLGVNLSIELQNISMTQTTPWTVTTNCNYSITLGKRTVWFDNVSMDLESSTSIIGLTNPSTLIQDIDERTIQKANTTTWTEETFLQHIQDKTFVFNENATSFLQRFSGSTSSSSCCGIESLINASDVDDINYTYVDYLYDFGAGECDGGNELYYTSGLGDFDIMTFKLDYPRIEFYNIPDMGGSIYASKHACDIS